MFRERSTLPGKSRNICILTSVHSALDVRIFHKEAKALAGAGYNVTLIAQHDRDEVVDAVTIIALPRPKNRLGRMTKITWRLLHSALKEKAHVYHFHDPELIPAGIVLRLLGKKVIYDVHEDVPSQILYKEWIGATWVRKCVASIVHILEQMGAAVFTRVVAATPDIANKFNPSKTVLVRNLSVIGLIDNIKPLEIEKQKPIIIYSGGLTRVRGIKEIIKAMEFIKDRAELWLLGRWNDEEFENECKVLDGWRYTKYFGFIPYGKHYSYLKAANMGIINYLPLPNHIKALPNKPFEYMACALPMAMSNFADWQRIFKECALFSDPCSSEDIAERILYLLDNPDKAKQLGDRGRQLVTEKYSWENESKKLIKVYEELYKE
ncbi:MAG: glycosyltransferase family 4 protein [Planctomycetota bacterium]|jgi:glycosyltransferase involved in cell wall biosynthesis